MILRDFKCKICEEITEEFVDSDRTESICPICNGYSEKIFSTNNTAVVDSPWIADVREIVNKKSKAPHIKEFLRHPTRANHKKWMDGENLRPLEPGEEPNLTPPDPVKEKAKIKQGLLEARQRVTAVRI